MTKKYNLLREYSQENIEIYTSLIEQSITQLPFTLAYPIEQLYKSLKKENYGKAMNHALDFFETSVQYLSCVLLVMTQENENGNTPTNNDILEIINKIDNKRPLSFGDWIQDIFTPLTKSAFKQLPDNDLIKSLKSALIIKNTNVLLGIKGEQSVVNIRNEYKGHSTTLSEDIYKGVIHKLETLILIMLKALEPLHDSIAYSGVEGSNIFWHKGCENTRKLPFNKILKPSHYYLQLSKESDPIDLFPLIFSNENGYVYVFQTLKEESVSYVSSNENAVTFNSDCYNDEFDLLLQRTSPAFDISKTLNWNEIVTLTNSESKRFLERIYKEKKYNQELFVDREQLSSILTDFHSSNKIFFPLLGEAGQGKTNQLCFWTEQHIDNKQSVLLIGGSDFSSITLEDKIKYTLGKKSRNIRKTIDSIHKQAVENNNYIYIYFDAINECLHYCNSDKDGPIALFDAIRELFIDAKYTHFKVLFTCRNYTWKTLLQPHIPKNTEHMFSTNDDDEMSVRGFTYSELEQAYEIYRQLYQMETNYNGLSRSTTIRLKDPLMLKVACTNYIGSELSQNMASYTSIALFGNMTKNISGSYAGKKQCEIIKAIANHILNQYEQGNPSDRISVSELRAAYNNPNDQLHKLSYLIFKKDGFTVAYTELLNKPERPILRVTSSINEYATGNVQFIYERFLEYIMALVFVERERGELGSNESISAQKFVDAVNTNNANVVFIGAIRNAVIIDCLQSRSIKTIISLVKDFGDDYEATLLVNEVFNVLIRENYEELIFELLNALLNEQIPDSDRLIEEFNIVDKKIGNNESNSEVIAQYKELHIKITPVIRMRRQALVSTLNGIYLTDFFNENLYTINPFSILEQLFTNTITDIRNDTCMYAYYLSNKKYTLEHTLLIENLSERVVKELYENVKQYSLLRNICSTGLRKRALIFTEAATRLSTLLIMEGMMSEKSDDQQQAIRLFDQVRSIFRYGSVNFKLIKPAMLIINPILRRQLTFQATYVNNLMEYSVFWDNAIVPLRSSDSSHWSRESISELIKFVYHYHNCKYDTSSRISSEFIALHDKVASAYKITEAFSFFILERLIIIMGVSSWENVDALFDKIFSEENRQSEWFEYSQMSILYCLFQIQVHSGRYNDKLMAIYERECEKWTLRQRGIFKARNSHRTHVGSYKRNIMNWYCVVYCIHTGDGIAHAGDDKCTPLFYRLIEKSIENNDKELLFHLLENISELISDFGYIKTALGLLHYTMSKLGNSDKVTQIDSCKIDRDGAYQYNITQLIGNVLTTAKQYYPSEVNLFIKRDILGLTFHGVSKYREEILDFNPSGEKLSDLLTHKFGNFLMWALLNKKEVDDFANEAILASIESKNSFKWCDAAMKILFKHMFGVRI